MTNRNVSQTLQYLPQFTSRMMAAVPTGLSGLPDSLAAWAARYLTLAVIRVRSPAVTQKIALHLDRFVGFFVAAYGHDRITTCLKRDVVAWHRSLIDADLAPATVNNHLASLSAFTTDGRLLARAINLILEQIGCWHDAEFPDPARRIAPLRPHDPRHTFAFHLATATGADAYELERRLGHRSQRHIQRYTNPPEEVAAAYVEEFEQVPYQ